MENISIREVEGKDADFLFNLMNNESILNSLNEIPSSLDNWQRAITEWNKEHEEHHIIFDNNIPIGWLGINNLSSQDKQAWIKIIAILPRKQGLGIGPYVINQLNENLKLRGYKSIALYTDRSNVNAQKCYQKCGFVITDTPIKKMHNGKYVERYKMEVRLK